MTPPSDSIEARIAALHQFVSVPHDEWSSSFWHSQLDDALEVIDALAEHARYAERELSICAYCGVAFKWDGRGDSCPGCDRAEAAERERDDLGNQLAQERSKPEGSFDQWARLQAAEAEAKALREALDWIAEFAAKMPDSHTGFVHVERRARTALATPES